MALKLLFNANTLNLKIWNNSNYISECLSKILKFKKVKKVNYLFISSLFDLFFQLIKMQTSLYLNELNRWKLKS